MSADLYHGFFFFFFLSFFLSFSLSFFFSPSNLMPWLPHARKWVRFENACPKSKVSHPPTNRGPKNHFSTTSQLNGSSTAYIFGTKQDVNKRANALTTRRDLLHRLETTWTLIHKRLQIWHEFSPTLRKFCVLHCHASQTEISKRNSTILCQTVDDESRRQSAVEKLGSFLVKKLGAKNFYICSVFADFGT